MSQRIKCIARGWETRLGLVTKSEQSLGAAGYGALTRDP